MYTTRRESLGTLAPVAANIGSRVYADMRNGKRTLRMICRINATVTLAGGPATGLRNIGDPWALISSFGIEENGVDRWNVDPRAQRFLTEMIAPRAQSAVRINNFANGAYTLTSTIVIPFAWPLGVRSVDTAFMERDERQALQFFIVPNLDGTRLVTTAGTATVSNVTVNVIQEYDDLRSQRPLFLPTARMLNQAFPATVTQEPFYLKTARYIAGMAVMQDSNVGEVSDVLTALALLGDRREIIGPQPIATAQLAQAMQLDFGGAVQLGGFSAVATTPGEGAYLGFNFREGGRLSNIINPARDTNFRLSVNATPSVTPGATSQNLRVMLLELERVPGLTTDSLPFEV